MKQGAANGGGFAALPGTLRGPLWMVLGGIALVAMAITIRVLAPRYSVLELIFLRSVISLGLILPWAVRGGTKRLRTRRLALHGMRNVVHYLGNLFWFLGVTLVSLADLAALQFTVPLFTVVLAALVLGERVGRHRWRATAVGFLGALVIIRPGMIEIGPGTAAVLLSAIFYASSQITTKLLSRTESANAVLFYMAVIFVPLSAVPAAFVWVTPGWDDAVPILLLGIFGYAAHACIIRAFAAADASFVMAFDFLRLPVSAFLGFVLYLERPDLWTWTGAVIIFAATWYITWRETRLAAPAPLP